MWSLVREIGWSANDKFRRQTLWGRDITIFLFVGGIENVFFWIFFYICVIFSRGDQGLTGEALGGWSDRKDRLAISCFNFETKKKQKCTSKMILLRSTLLESCEKVILLTKTRKAWLPWQNYGVKNTICDSVYGSAPSVRTGGTAYPKTKNNKNIYFYLRFLNLYI